MASNNSTANPPSASSPNPISNAEAPAESTENTTFPPGYRPRQRSSTAASVASNASSRLRAASIKLMNADPPPGMWAATGSVVSKAPSLKDIRRGSYDREGWNEEVQREVHAKQEQRDRAGSGGYMSRRHSQGSSIAPAVSPVALTPSGALGVEPFPALTEEPTNAGSVHDGSITAAQDSKSASAEKSSTETKEMQEASTTRSTNKTVSPYEPPPKLPWTTSTMVGLQAFWHWFLTIPGFLITLYGLNVVAWGGMLFLLLCNASPAMCHPTCDDIDSPRRVWIEIDSQILNALFCVTGFGLAPWRFRDLYWWGVWRLGRSEETKSKGIRRLAGIHNGWFRLPGSDQLDESIGPDTFAQGQGEDSTSLPIPLSKSPKPPLTSVRAPPTRIWKMDFVIWMNVWNTFFQCCLAGFMWGMNRYKRPSWSTGLFVALACIVAGAGGWVMFQEGKKVKKVEGVAMSKEERKARGYPLEEVQDEESRGAVQQDVKVGKVGKVGKVKKDQGGGKIHQKPWLQALG